MCTSARVCPSPAQYIGITLHDAPATTPTIGYRRYAPHLLSIRDFLSFLTLVGCFEKGLGHSFSELGDLQATIYKWKISREFFHFSVPAQMSEPFDPSVLSFLLTN